MKTSLARVAANQANAQASTGPITAEGKERASRNALAHGLTSKRVVLPGEKEAEFETLRLSLRREHKPASDVEREQVDLVAQLYWRLQRAYRVEAAFLDQSIQSFSCAEPEEAIARMFSGATESKQLGLLMRYLASAERAYNKALADLRRMQTERRKTEKIQLRRQLWVNPNFEPDAVSDAVSEEAGFVSQSPDSGAGCQPAADWQSA